MIPVYPDLIRKVPLLVRLAALAIFSIMLTSIVVEPAVRSGERSFTSLVIVIFISLAAGAVLLPGQSPFRPTVDGTPQTPGSATPRPSGSSTSDGSMHRRWP